MPLLRVSLLAVKEAAEQLGFETESVRTTVEDLSTESLPCILFWNQNHFVVLYKISSNRKKFFIADPAKGKVKYSIDEFKRHWIPENDSKGIVMWLEKGKLVNLTGGAKSSSQSFYFLWPYIKRYKQHFVQILFGLFVGCILQLILPFLTQSIVDIGIHTRNIHFIWLVLLGEFMIVVGRTATDFIRRWLLLHISIRVNIFIISDFFVKLLKLPMSFFDTKLMGDLLQRIGDHSRVQSFLTSQLLNTTFSIVSFAILEPSSSYIMI